MEPRELMRKKEKEYKEAGLDNPDLGREEHAEAILEQIRDAMRERGPVAYEELIRAYFRALSRQVRGEEDR